MDGCNYFETSLAFKESFQRARRGKGPSIVISNVVRLLPHSSSDDQRKYRSEKDLKEDLKRDPIKVFENDCLQAKIATLKEFEKIKNEISLQVDLDAEWADKQIHPAPETALDHIYSGVSFPQEKEFESISDKIVIVDAINHALSEEMELNEKMVIYGQDIADPKGVFTATKGLSEKQGVKEF